MKLFARLIFFLLFFSLLAGYAFATTYIVTVRWGDDKGYFYNPGIDSQFKELDKMYPKSVGQFTKLVVLGKQGPIFDGWTEATGQKTININEENGVLITSNAYGSYIAPLLSKAEFNAGWTDNGKYPSETIGVWVTLKKKPIPFVSKFSQSLIGIGISPIKK